MASVWDTYGLTTLNDLVAKKQMIDAELAQVQSMIDSLNVRKQEIRGQLSVLRALKQVGQATVSSSIVASHIQSVSPSPLVQQVPSVAVNLPPIPSVPVNTPITKQTSLQTGEQASIPVEAQETHVETILSFDSTPNPTQPSQSVTSNSYTQQIETVPVLSSYGKPPSQSLMILRSFNQSTNQSSNDKPLSSQSVVSNQTSTLIESTESSSQPNVQ